MKRSAAIILLFGLLLAGCEDNPDARSRDVCVRSQLSTLSSIDHEQPSTETVQAIIDFCERQYPEQATAQTPGEGSHE